ncbi:hypothetical protein QJQ45_025435 [Haematococcus lacustris]|nr:hypothetical protein QJQ45_025435 [Haematococcus lacustris]
MRALGGLSVGGAGAGSGSGSGSGSASGSQSIAMLAGWAGARGGSGAHKARQKNPQHKKGGDDAELTVHPSHQLELFRDGEVSCSTDIYAFGITLWELVHGKPAYKDPDPYAIMVAVLHGDRPAWSAPLEAQLVHLARMYRRCVSASPDARPSATELVGELARLEDAARQESQRQSKELMRMQRVSKELARQQPAAWERVNKELPQQGPTALESVL